VIKLDEYFRRTIKHCEIIVIKLKIREMHATIQYDNSSSLRTSVHVRQELRSNMSFLYASTVICIPSEDP
jgi:hypothetical protein